MRLPHFIRTTRLKGDFAAGKIPDYQMAAFLMAVFFRGLDSSETRALTLAMRDSGEVLKFPKDPRPLVDKHSTGGVGDKVSLPLAPLLACLGLRVPMISGRGLGITGGTSDKLDSISDFKTTLPAERVIEIVQSVGCVIRGQTDRMVPADRKLYALRDVTGTVPSIPLIVASILSKKLVESLDALVLDVKFGSAAFMQTREQAHQLAEAMVALGNECGVNTRALLTRMDAPLGRAAGNWLEVKESIAVLEPGSRRGQTAQPSQETCEREPASATTDGGRVNDLRELVLSAIGSRVNAQWIFKWLENPKHFRGSAVMPALLENVQDRADVAAYLQGLKAPRQKVQYAGTAADRAARGKEMFLSIGCAACHSEGSVELNGVSSKYRYGELANYLLDPLAIDPTGRMPNMNLSKEEAMALADYLAQFPNKTFEELAPKGNSTGGKRLVETSGCLNCHTLDEPRVKLETKLSAAPFKSLSANKGCLAENPGGKVARYFLTDSERESIAAFLQSPDISEAPAQDLHRLANRFRCQVCHEMHASTPVTFDQPSPPLFDAGNKLRSSWLDAVLNKQKRIRPWMKLRMPHFGEANTRSMSDRFAAQAGAELGEGETIAPPTPDQIQQGITSIGSGDGGLSCINCHDFGGEKSVGDLRGPDLTEMYARIRVDWLRRWLREPSRIQAGTAMPAFFSDLLEAAAETKMTRIIQALWAGKNMPPPSGLMDPTQNYLLVVQNEPILLRTFMPDSSPQSIAVGLPGGQSYCFDAHLCRLRYAWSGGFLDVKPVWTGRGGQNANIIGKKYYTAPNMFPLRSGDPNKEPAVKFRGYKLVNKIPEFIYDVEGVPVRERITAATNGSGLVCSFDLGPVPGGVWFLAGQSENVIITSSSGEFTGGRLKIAGGKSVRFEITILAK